LDTLLEGFWLSNNWRFNYGKTKLLSTMQVVDCEEPIMRPYCGPKNLKPALAYTPFKDLNNGFFFLVRLHDPLLVSMLMGRTQSDVIKDDQNTHFKMAKLQWWDLVKERSNLVCMKIVEMTSGIVI